jgi:hypothetical protein
MQRVLKWLPFNVKTESQNSSFSMSKLDLKNAFQKPHIRSHLLKNEGPLKEGPSEMRSNLKRLTPAYKENLSWWFKILFTYPYIIHNYPSNNYSYQQVEKKIRELGVEKEDFI